MLKKLLLVSAMAVSMNANALVLNVSGVDVNGASLDKTAIINLPSQSTVFDFFGSLDLSNKVQASSNPGAEFGLYLNNAGTGTLIKPITDFTASAGDIYSFNFTNLAAGDYSLRFNVTSGGSYALTSTINTVTTPVPEANTYSMIMLGLGVMGAVVSRRKLI
jgi:hypothetical protein